MRSAALAILALAGCSYRNPWDTSRDEQAYEAQTARAVDYKVIEPHPGPQADSPAFNDPDLEGWRDTVLATADDETLRSMKEAARKRLAAAEARRAELLKLDEHTRAVPLTEAESDLRVQTRRLEMIEERLRTGAPRRAP